MDKLLEVVRNHSVLVRIGATDDLETFAVFLLDKTNFISNFAN